MLINRSLIGRTLIGETLIGVMLMLMGVTLIKVTPIAVGETAGHRDDAAAGQFRRDDAGCNLRRRRGTHARASMLIGVMPMDLMLMSVTVDAVMARTGIRLG